MTQPPQFTTTNHGSKVPMPQKVHWDWLWRERRCRSCGVTGATSHTEIDSDYGDVRYRCEKSLGGCGLTWVAEGGDS